MQILLIDGLRLAQSFDAGANVLDVAWCDDVMYISLDASEGSWMVELQYTSEWEPIQSTQWKLSQREAQTIPDLYWLEDMRKRVGQVEN